MKLLMSRNDFQAKISVPDVAQFCVREVHECDNNKYTKHKAHDNSISGVEGLRVWKTFSYC